jgi:hypothetical protein
VGIRECMRTEVRHNRWVVRICTKDGWCARFGGLELGDVGKLTVVGKCCGTFSRGATSDSEEVSAAVVAMIGVVGVGAGVDVRQVRWVKEKL